MDAKLIRSAGLIRFAKTYEIMLETSDKKVPLPELQKGLVPI